jgi:hypothetical protein
MGRKEEENDCVFNCSFFFFFFFFLALLQQHVDSPYDFGFFGALAAAIIGVAVAVRDETYVQLFLFQQALQVVAKRASTSTQYGGGSGFRRVLFDAGTQFVKQASSYLLGTRLVDTLELAT